MIPKAAKKAIFISLLIRKADINPAISHTPSIVRKIVIAGLEKNDNKMLRPKTIQPIEGKK